MLKVLLVDDEMFVRKGMHELIDWHALGMEITGKLRTVWKHYKWRNVCGLTSSLRIFECLF